MIKRKNKSIQKKTVKDIEEKRTGGQIALRGFGYQIKYSCYILLNFIDDNNKMIRFEGIEDVDLYKSTLSNNEKVEHIQLKYSTGKVDASFFNSILKNYLEVYLSDNKNINRIFKLVYDAEVSEGNLSKLVNKNLDNRSKIYWEDKIQELKNQYRDWNWDNFNFDDLYSQMEFENLKSDYLIESIDKLIIERFDVALGNEILFRNALFYNVFHMAKKRQEISYDKLLEIIENTKDSIAKGYQNPAYNWIDRIDFDAIKVNDNIQYFEGKKATPADIIKGYPIRRSALEEKIKKSLTNNKITVIKSSSGQGKSTLAWQVAYDLKNEYSIYKLNWCNKSEEINNIIEFFNSRLKLGEKLLIIIDNLDEDTKEWNKLAQALNEKISINYSVLITTREDDWYNLSGDQSNIIGLNIIKIFVDYEQAEQVYLNLKMKNMIHGNIKRWQTAWEKVKDKNILIEYIYLLTHGEMIEERISSQLRKLKYEKNSREKYEILRIIALADVIGIRLRMDKLIKKFTAMYTSVDLNEIIQSIENEYFIKFDKNTNYIEGVHPVRSRYIIDTNHEYYDIEVTFIKLLDSIDELYVGKIYSQIPNYIQSDKDEFYKKLASIDCNKSYEYMCNAIQGIFCGDISKYYSDNKDIFDDADTHGGLPLFVHEINPWNNKEFGNEVKPLSAMSKFNEGKSNIEYLLNLTKKINKHNVKQANYYIYAYYLFEELKNQKIKRIKFKFADLANWLRRINKRFDILTPIDFYEIWSERNEWDFNELSRLINVFYLLSKEKYEEFVFKFKKEILTYLEIKTDSVKLFEKDESIHVEYILLPQDMQKSNEESMKRINHIYSFLPIYKLYCSNSIKPDIDCLKNFSSYIDNSHKEIAAETVKLSFNSDLNILWNKSILSQYEFESIYEWQEYWINVRKDIVEFLKLNIEILEKKIKGKNINNVIKIDTIREDIIKKLVIKRPFPHEERPFEERVLINDSIHEFKKGYFSYIQNYIRQFINIIKKDSNLSNLAVMNLMNCKYELRNMQKCFNKICNNSILYFSSEKLEKDEEYWINKLTELNEYYLNNDIHLNFNRDDVRNWHEKKLKILKRRINNIINNAEKNSIFKFITASKFIVEGILKTIPIGIKGFDIADGDNWETLLLSLIPLEEINVDYILLIIINERNKTLYRGFKINVNLFKELKNSINRNEHFHFRSEMVIPYIITDKELEYFNEPLTIEENIKTEKLENIDICLLYLWEYTQYRQLFYKTNGEEKKYLFNKIVEQENKISNCLEKIINTNKFENIKILINLTKSVLKEGVDFGNDELNIWINKFYGLGGQ